MAHDRAWRNLASRPISPQIFTKARPDAKDLFAPDASSAAIEAGSISEPNRDRAILPVAMMVMIGVSFGGVLGLAGWPERRPAFISALDLDQAIDDLAALHQQAMHGRVDAIDLRSQVGERRSRGFFSGLGHGALRQWLIGLSHRSAHPGMQRID